MKRSRFTEEQIVYTVKQGELGVPTGESCRMYGVSQATTYRWRKLYGGLSSSELKRLRELEGENRRLKQLVADLSLDKQILQDVLAKRSEARRAAGAIAPGHDGVPDLSAAGLPTDSPAPKYLPLQEFSGQ